MTLPLWIIAIITVAETVLILLVLLFFSRLRRSEALITRLQISQEKVLERIYHNAELEQDLVASFQHRQEQLQILNQKLEERVVMLQRLIEQADGVSRSPHFLREIIVNGQRRGLSVSEIAAQTGLAEDEVELILTK